LAVKIRLTRLGRKKRPFYRIVAVDSRAPRDGMYIENLGTYDPLKEQFEVKLREDRILHWLKVGAIPTNTVRSILSREGVLFKWDLYKKGYDEARIAEEMKKWEVIKLERQRKLERIEAEKRAKAKKVEAPVEEEQEKTEKVEQASAGVVEEGTGSETAGTENQAKAEKKTKSEEVKASAGKQKEQKAEGAEQKSTKTVTEGTNSEEVESNNQQKVRES